MFARFFAFFAFSLRDFSEKGVTFFDLAYTLNILGVVMVKVLWVYSYIMIIRFVLVVWMSRLRRVFGRLADKIVELSRKHLEEASKRPEPKIPEEVLEGAEKEERIPADHTAGQEVEME